MVGTQRTRKKLNLRSLPLFLGGFLFSALLHAQVLEIKDKENSEGLPSVLVFSENDQAIGATNHQGRIELKQEYDSLIFKLYGYKTLSMAFSQAIREGVFLEAVNIDLEEVVVSSNKWSEEIKYVPQQIQRITSEEIKTRDPVTTADALSSTGQVFVQRSQLGGGSPMLRGFAANKILLSIDGVRMNNAIYRSGNLQNVIVMDANSLDNMEVIYGPGSVIYGSDALGGVISMKTRNPEFSLDSNSQVFGGGFARFSSANFEKTIGVDINYGKEKWASFTQFTLSDFEDLRSGAQFDDRDPDFGRRDFYVQRYFFRDTIIRNEDPENQIPSGYRQLNLLQKFRFDLGKGLELDASLIFSTTNDIPRYDRLTQTENGRPVNAEWYYGPQEYLLGSIGLNLRAKKLYDRARITLAYQRIIEERNDRRFQNDFLRNRRETVNVISLNKDFQKKLDRKNELNYGIEFIYNHVCSQAKATNILSGMAYSIPTRYPDAGNSYFSAAAYTNYILKMEKGVTLNSGLRLNYVGIRSKFEDTSFYAFPYSEISLDNLALSGSVGIKKNWPSRSNVYFNLGSGFRSPNLDDVAKVFDSEPGNVVVPNPDLKPEYLVSAEAGFNKNFSDALVLRANVFYSIWFDAIIRANYSINGQDSIIYDGTLSKVQAEQNLGRADLAGAFAKIEWFPIKQIKVWGSLTYTWGETESGEPLRHVPPIFGNAGIELKRTSWLLRGDVNYSGGIKFSDLAPSEQAKPYIYSTEGALSWVIMNLSLSKKIHKKAEVQGMVENLLDRHYRSYSSGISAPGRNFRLSARVYF